MIRECGDNRQVIEGYESLWFGGLRRWWCRRRGHRYYPACPDGSAVGGYYCKRCGKWPLFVACYSR